jgi:signal transduction histidine kinase
MPRLTGQDDHPTLRDWSLDEAMASVSVARQGPALPTVWIVDDSPLDAELIRRTLTSIYRVEVFTDGGAVIEHLASAPPPDAVILDWQMPGISGLEVCQFLRARSDTQAIPILMLTVQRDTHDLVRCLAAGADDFLSKPHNQAELSARIAALIRSKRMRERLESAERAVRSLLMQLPEAVMSVDAAGHISFINLEAERMLDRSAASLLGRTLRDVLPEFSFDRELASTLVAVSLPDLVLGDRVFAPAIRRYAGVDATETTLSFREVTLERQHDAERARLLGAERAARTQAEQASRAKDEFLAVVSHELRTPLNAILGWAHMLRRGSLDEAKRERALEVIERNASAQQKLIEDILDVSRITSGKLQITSSPVSLVTSVQTACEAVRPAADDKAIEITIDAADDPVVLGDPGRMQQVVSNLLSNAVKFTPRGGAVFVKVATDGASASIRVTDTGQGISADFLPYIFDRFRQGDTGTTRAHGGLGLGLSIVRHLVEIHGGSVTAQSDGPGTGSTFTVCLPLRGVEHATRGAATKDAFFASPGSGSLEGIRVLVVDDDKDTRELIVAMLTERRGEAIAVSSAAEGLLAVRSFCPHVIVSDIGMPTDDGYAFVERLRLLDPAEGGSTPIVALTAFAGPQDRERALRAGFDTYVAKPVGSAELATVIANLRAPQVAG